MPKLTHDLLRGILVLTLLFVSVPLVHACPNCKDGIAGEGTHSGLAQGFFWSILWMLSMPVLILTGLSSYFYWLVRRARKVANTVDGASAAIRPAASATAAPVIDRRVNSLPTWEELMARGEPGM